MRSLSHPVTPYDDANEDPNVEPKDVLNYDYKDERFLITGCMTDIQLVTYRTIVMLGRR
jgi:hypothetical protein